MSAATSHPIDNIIAEALERALRPDVDTLELLSAAFSALRMVTTDLCDATVRDVPYDVPRTTDRLAAALNAAEPTILEYLPSRPDFVEQTLACTVRIVSRFPTPTDDLRTYFNSEDFAHALDALVMLGSQIEALYRFSRIVARMHRGFTPEIKTPCFDTRVLN